MATDPNLEQQQLEWWAAAMGMTPQDLVQKLAIQQEAEQAPQRAQDAQNWPALTQAAQTGQWVNSRINVNDPILDAMAGYTGATFQQQGAINQKNQAIGWNSGQDAQELGQRFAGLQNESIASRDYGNAADQATLGQLREGLGAASAWDLANYGNLAGAAANTPMLQARGWSGDLVSSAARAQADPAAIAAQNQAQGFLQGAMGGSLDYRSQAAGAYADPAAINAQYDSLAQLQGAAGGSLNQSSQAALAHASQQAIQKQYEQAANLERIAGGSLNVTSQGQYVQADPYAIAQQQQAADSLQELASGRGDVNFWGIEGIHNLQRSADGGLDVDFSSLDGARNLDRFARGGYDVNPNDIQGLGALQAASQGSLDIRPGQLDPSAYAAQQDALAQWKAGTTPEMTAAEQLIVEQNRRQQDQDLAANRAAVLDDMQRRGVAGGAAEIASGYGASRQISDSRQLGDLQALASAQARAERYLGGYGTQANVLGAQANAMAEGNATRSLNAMQQYAGITSEVAQANKARQLAAAGQYAGLESSNAQANNSRTLDAQRFYSGMSADVETANKLRQLQAQGMAVDAFGNIRQQSMDEGAYRADSLDAANRWNSELQLRGSESAYDAAAGIRDTEFSEGFARGTAADTVNAANATRQLQAMGFSNDAATNIRNSSFDERFRTGEAADLASYRNASNRLQAGSLSGTLATQMRDSSFNEDFSRRTADDMTNQFNKQQSMISQRFQDEYAARERDAQWGRTTDVADLGVKVGDNFGRYQTSLANAGFTVNNNTDQRNQTSITTRAGLSAQALQAQEEARRTQLGINAQESGTLSQQLNSIYGLGGQYMNNNNAKTALGMDYEGLKMGATLSDIATQTARPAQPSPSALTGESDNWFNRWQKTTKDGRIKQ